MLGNSGGPQLGGEKQTSTGTWSLGVEVTVTNPTVDVCGFLSNNSQVCQLE
jgi:hypothetical protein